MYVSVGDELGSRFRRHQRLRVQASPGESDETDERSLSSPAEDRVKGADIALQRTD